MTVLGRRRRQALGAFCVVALLFAGCSGDDDTSPTTTSTSTTLAATSSTSAPASTSTTAGGMPVQVFFVDQDAFDEGRPPYVTPVERTVAPSDPARGALDALFAGPSEQERAQGLRLVASQATGISDLRIEDGTAHVTLAGGCSSGGSTLNVGEEIVATLLQFEGVRTVKIYDPQGRTESPDEPGDSIPECLEP